MIDVERARQSFQASRYIQSLWPESLKRDTLAYFDYQGIINHVMLVGAEPLRDIEHLHRLLTTTELRRLPPLGSRQQ